MIGLHRAVDLCNGKQLSAVLVYRALGSDYSSQPLLILSANICVQDDLALIDGRWRGWQVDEAKLAVRDRQSDLGGIDSIELSDFAALVDILTQIGGLRL